MNENEAGSRQGRSRKIVANAAISFALTLLVWIVFSWPLPRHVFAAIPYVAAGVLEPDPHLAGPVEGADLIHEMEPGDHLQLLYHFWLFEDMLTGHTPWFHNLYEFNLGDDAARRETGAYYFPFSFFFAAGDVLAGRAFGWNFAGFISLWLTLLMTCGLLRRYRTPEPWAWLLGVVSIALPFRWYTLLGGSPAGLAMCWPPMLMLGLDIAVREDRWRGGALAGLALLLSAWTDTHAFFFGSLLCPCWCVVSLILREQFPWRRIASYLRIAAALLPVAAALALAMLTTRNMTGTVDTAGLKQRPDREVLLSSPTPEGLFSWHTLGVSNHIFLGVCLAVILLTGLLAMLTLRLRGRQDGRRLIAMLMVIAGMIGITLLAVGLSGWHEGYVFRQARRFIPHYGMIRQCGKIFCLMPTLIAVALAWSVQSILALARLRQIATMFCATLLLGALVEFRAHYNVRLTTLLKSNEAYSAIADDARAGAGRPHALVLPFWPGDSHFASVYQYYCSLYRIRMVNGYRPFVPGSYRIDYFRSIASANEGDLSDAQLDDLQKRGVNYIVLHEDLFPEKVSPRPVTWTLKQLLNHPRLKLLAHHGTVWSWRIEREPHPVTPAGTSWTTWFPTQKAARTPVAADFTHGPSITWPAPLFFHRGTINLANDSIDLDPIREHPGIVLYGPRLTIEPGSYEMNVHFTTPVHNKTLGHWSIECPEGDRLAWVKMKGTSPFVIPFTVDATNAPLLLIFAYDSAAPVEIQSVTLRRR